MYTMADEAVGREGTHCFLVNWVGPANDIGNAGLSVLGVKD